MKVEQRTFTQAKGWSSNSQNQLSLSAQLVLAFGSTSVLRNPSIYPEIQKLYPQAKILGGSTAGEIMGTRVFDDSLVLTAVAFEKTRLFGNQISLEPALDNYHLGKRLVESIPLSLSRPASEETDPLVHVFVLSDGLHINGSELVRGMVEHLPRNVTVTGGLAGDGERFTETLVFLDHVPQEKTLAILGFYSRHLRVGFGSLGGWDSFGPERLITRSQGNILYEFDGRSALDLYKKYLGDLAQGLPATGLHFPLSVRVNSKEAGVVRTLLAINEEEQSVTFAGDVPEGAYARLMKANFDRLIDGAIGAARISSQTLDNSSPELAILISCVGRKVVLGQRVEEEVEGVRDILGQCCPLTGFYSYGEISPFTPGEKCELHNQTMTITVFSEE